MLVGKTNLDQFATGLNGTRTPYPVPRSVFGRDLISGGSSSGSALAVALGEVPFTVATDTAGSGRVPPALNGDPRLQAVPRTDQRRRSGAGLPLAGLHQPDRRYRSRDLRPCSTSWPHADRRDPWSRSRPPSRTGSEDDHRSGCRTSRRSRVLRRRRDGGRPCCTRGRRSASAFATSAVDLSPFLAAGELLYQGPVGGRAVGRVRRLPRDHPDDVVPVVGEIISGGARYSAVDVFRAQYRLAELKAAADRLFESRRRDGGADHRHHVHRRAGAGRSDRHQHRARATTPTSATCSTCAPSPYRPGPPPTAGRPARWCSARRWPTTVLAACRRESSSPCCPRPGERTSDPDHPLYPTRDRQQGAP